MARSGLLLSVALLLTLDAAVAPVAQQPAERDAFAVVRAIDGTRARQVWPGFDPAEWPIAVFDGTQTILLRHPTPPSEFTQMPAGAAPPRGPMPGQPAVFTMRGRYPALLGNSTRDIAGVRTATVIAPPTQPLDNILLAYVEEVFHVFFLRRHANIRPNEMVRYGYPVSDAWNLERILAEDEALARALDASSLAEAAAWATGGAAHPPRATRRAERG